MASASVFVPWPWSSAAVSEPNLYPLKDVPLLTVKCKEHLNTPYEQSRHTLWQPGSAPPSLLTLWHICDARVSPQRACTSPPCLSLSGWNRSWGPAFDRLTGVHHSLGQKNQQHDGCVPRWHLQPEPQSWFKSTPLSHLCSLCVCVCVVTDILYCRVLHVSSTHHSVWWNKVNQLLFLNIN